MTYITFKTLNILSMAQKLHRISSKWAWRLLQFLYDRDWRLSSQVSVYVWSPAHFSVVYTQDEITFTYVLSYIHEPGDHVTYTAQHTPPVSLRHIEVH